MYLVFWDSFMGHQWPPALVNQRPSRQNQSIINRLMLTALLLGVENWISENGMLKTFCI